MSRNFWLVTVVLIVVAALATTWLVSYAPAVAESRAMVLPDDPEPLVIETLGGYRTFTIEIADDPRERERGLMFRESLPDNHGMLFVFETQRTVSFWMKYTPVALDVIFISEDGRVKSIRRGEPFSDEAMSPINPVKFVLELNAGTAERNQIVDWVRVSHRVMPRAPSLH